MLDFKDYMYLSGSVVNSKYKEETELTRLANEFEEKGFVTMPDFFMAEFFDLVKDESIRLSKMRTEKQFTMPGYETPRFLSVIGGKQILNNSFVFSALYINAEVKSVLSSIVSRSLYTVDHEEEFMVVNFLERSGGTHGWHLDDPQYALVSILQAPDHSMGGYLEVIPEWKKFCAELGMNYMTDTNKAVPIAYEQGRVKNIHHNAGDCYVLNAGDCLHRVAPISGETNRIILNMAFDHRSKIDYGATADILYGEKEGALI